MRNRWIGWILSLLGLATAAGCEESTKEEPRAEYGTPYVTYEVKGKVTNADGAVVPGIRVTMPETNRSTLADDEGTYWMRGMDFSHPKPEEGKGVTFTLLIDDVDGAENGSYAMQKVEVTFTEEHAVEFKPEGNWHWNAYVLSYDINLGRDLGAMVDE